MNRLVEKMVLGWVIMFSTAVPSIAAVPTTQPVHAGSRMIQSEHLAVELMDPTAPDRYNRGVRFTSIAAVIRVVGDGREYLFHNPTPNPATDVAGLFGEFDLKTDPPNFAAAVIGDSFIKIGVGRLRKTTKDYQFYTAYPVQTPADSKAKWSEDAVDFDQTLPADSGGGYRLQSRVSVADRTLTMTWTLTNLGTQPISTEQYLHNSFRFDQRPIGEGYVLSFPFDFAARGLKDSIRQTGRELAFIGVLKKPVNLDIDYPKTFAAANTFHVQDAVTSMAVDGETSLAGNRIAVHIADTYVCPEQFIDLFIKPGESESWQRTYVFH